MSTITPILSLYAMQQGDVWFSGLDQRNMQIVENQLNSIAYYVGSGVISGWDVSWMSLSQNYPLSVAVGSIEYLSIQSQQQALINAYLTAPLSQLGVQFNSLFPIPILSTAAVIATSNISLLSPPSVIDGVTLTTGMAVLLTNQTPNSNNGIYTFNGSILSDQITLSTGDCILILNGTINQNTIWQTTQSNSGNIEFFDAWIQVIGVSAGTGIIAPFSAQTSFTYYFKYNGESVNYIFSAASFALPREQVAVITSSTNIDYASYNQATYLATVETAETSTSSNIYYVEQITYESQRNDLQDLSGALQQALDLYFYHHVHLGGPNHPSLINLSTSLLLNAVGQGDSPIYYLYPIGQTIQSIFITSGGAGYTSAPTVVFSGGDGNGAAATAVIAGGVVVAVDITSDGSGYLTAPTITFFGGGNYTAQAIATATLSPSSIFTWTGGTLQPLGSSTPNPTYGIPTVLLNGNVIPESEYEIVPTSGKISLKNNLLPGSQLQVELPLSPQALLTVNTSISTIADATIYLTDGVDFSGTTLRTFTWNSGYYAAPVVTLQGSVINSSLYTIDAFNGTITFSTQLTTPPYSNTDLSVLITYIGIQIQGTLPGKRVTDVNATTFTEGTIPSNRIIGLDHVGEFLLNEPCLIIPTHRIFALGDHYTYYPEILESDGITSATMQYNYTINSIGTSINISGPSVLVGTKRGLMVTSDGINYSLLPAWNNDIGEPIFFIDNILQADTMDNYFKTFYILTKQGQLYSSSDAGLSFQTVHLPIDINGNPIPGTCFYINTNRVDNDSNTGPAYTYSYIIWLGTAEGLWTATVPDGVSNNEWTWNQSSYVPSTDYIYSVISICTLNYTSSDISGDLTAFDFTTYVASTSGFYANGVQMPIPNVPSTENVIGITWLRGGPEDNNLLLYTAKNVYVTHTAQFIVYQDADTYQTYWIHPFKQFPTSGNVASPALLTAQVVEVNTLSSPTVYNPAVGVSPAYYTTAPTTVDDHVLVSGDLVLVVNNGSQNGVYVVQSTTSTWNLDAAYINVWNGANADLFVPLIWVSIDGSGSAYKYSAWTISLAGPGLSLYTTIANWNQQYIWSLGTTGNPISSAYQIPGYGYYAILSQQTLYLILDNYTTQFSTPTNESFVWNYSNQGTPTSIIAINGGDDYIIGSNYGIWSSISLSSSWSRAQNIFNATDQPTLYDATTGAVISGSTWTQNAQYQSFVFNSEQTIWQSFLYENQYQNYWTNPWLPTGAIVSININGLPASVPYSLSPSAGEITFANSLGPLATVSISVVRLGAYITDVGSTPHGELSNYFIVASSPVTQLSQAYPPASGANVLTLASPTAVPVDADYVQLYSAQGTAFLPISVNPNTYVISVLSPYTGSINFPALYTNVFLVTLGSVLGIEDQISLNQSNETYHLNSLLGANTIQLTVAMEEQYDNLFTDFSTPPTVGGSPDRGPVNALFFDFATESLDMNASYSTLNVSYEPSVNDVATNPVAVYAIYNASATGDGMIVGTDQGIWSYTASTTLWTKQSDLNGATRVYFITGADGVLTAGTELGVFRQNADTTWSPDPTFVQPTFAYSTGAWYSDTYESWGKSNGLAFVENTSTGFISDHFAPIDGTNVNGFFKGFYLTEPASTDTSSADATPTSSDELLICTDAGLFGVENGTVSAQFSSLLVGRDMFGGSLTQQIALPNGSTQTVSVKFYSIFTAVDYPSDPTSSLGNICLYIGTNNGLYVVRNWRWEAPHDSTTGTFTVQSLFFPGRSIYSSAVCTGTDIFGNPANKMFVGTDQGVNRSFSDGTSWQSCERFQTQILPVYSIQILGSGITFNTYTASTLLAGTANGLWISDDDGDNWYTPTVSNGQFNGVISNAQPFNLASLAQTFQVPSGAGSSPQILQINAYLEVDLPNPTSAGYTNSLLNTLTAQIYECNSEGVPTTPIGTDGGIMLPPGANTSLTVADILYPGFQTIYTPVQLPDNTSSYAVVITENSGGSGAVSVFRWHQSNLPQPYDGGIAFSGISSFTALGSGDIDMFFIVSFIAPTVPQFTDVNVGQLSTPNADNPGFSTGTNKGCVVTDSGYLTTAFKFATSITVDDSFSMAWADPGTTSPTNTTRLYYIQKLIDTICSRTTTGSYVASYFDFWTFGLSENESTNGYTNNQSLLDLNSSALFGNGTSSPLFDTTNIALQGLQPQSLIESVITGINPTSPLNNNSTTMANMTTLITYLQSFGILRLQDVLAYWNSLPLETASPWNGSANTIYLYNDVSTFVVKQWANTFIPIGFVVADGDDYGDINGGTSGEVSETAINAWLDEGSTVFSFGLGESNLEANLRSMVVASGGKCFDIATPSDWTTAINSLVHGGANSLFAATWSQSYDFDEPVFIQSIHASYIQPTHLTNGLITTDSICTVQFQYTIDRVNWTPWTNIPNDYGIGSPPGFIVNNFIDGINYQVILGDGWMSSTLTSVQPVVQALYHISVVPSTQYLVTLPQPINGMLFEYLMSAAADVPSTAQLTWGIVRGNSTNFSNFEPIINNRKACLPNTEQGILFIEESTLSGLSTTTSDFINYTVVQNGNTVYWASSDVIQVFANGTLIDNSTGVTYYGSNGATGIITFFGIGGGNPEQPSTVTITVSITTPSEMYESVGEITTTIDYKTFYAANGSWAPDATAIILVNNNIRRGGYWLNPSQGTMTFWQQLPATDVVTIYIQPSDVFRVGVLITNYSTTPVTLDNFGLYYTAISNNSLVYEYNNASSPELAEFSDGTYIKFTPANPNVWNRVQLEYNYVSADGDAETDTETAWFRSRDGGNTWVQIDTANSLPNYNNRITERLIDTGTLSENASALFLPNDLVMATVTPSNGFGYGTPESSVSPYTEFQLNPPPLVNNLSFSGTGLTFNSNGTITIPAGNTITAIYNFIDTNGGTDMSTLTWYLQDSNTPFQPASTAPITPQILGTLTTSGQTFSFSVLPVDSNGTGTLVWSDYITIT